MYAWQFAKALHVCRAHGWTRFVDDAELPQPALPRGRARDAAALQGRGHRRDPVEPARPRPPGARLGRGERALARPTSSAARSTRRRPMPTARSSRRVAAVAARLGSAARAGRARLGAAEARGHGADRRRDEARAARRRGRRARRSSCRPRTSPSSRRRTCRTRSSATTDRRACPRSSIFHRAQHPRRRSCSWLTAIALGDGVDQKWSSVGKRSSSTMQFQSRQATPR